jgi:hypothetical protein
MAENTLKFLERFGLTPASLLAGVAIAGAWWQTISPIPSEMMKLNQNVQLLATRVEVHAVLLAQTAEIKAELSNLRKDFNSIEVKLAQLKQFHAAQP